MKEVFNLIYNSNYSKTYIFSLMAAIMIISAAPLSAEIKAQSTINRDFVNNNTTTNPQTIVPLNNNTTTNPQTIVPLNNNTTTNPQTIVPLNNNTTTNSLLNLNGSLPVLQITTQALLSHLNTTMNEATLKALNEIGKRSIALSNTLDIVKGFLAYKVIVIDTNNNLHEVLVDSGNGKVLFSGTNIIDKNLVPSVFNGNQLVDNNFSPAPNMNNP